MHQEAPDSPGAFIFALSSRNKYKLYLHREIWTVPNQPATVTAALKDATGENVAPQEYSLCLESGAQAFSAALPQNSGEPRKLYKAAVLHIRPESERPAAPAGGSGGGCSAFGGTTALFAAGTLFAALRVKRKTR